MVPDIDRAALASDVKAWLKDKALTTRSASAIFTGLNPAMISRACRGDVLSAASLLMLCAAMGANPLDYLRLVDRAQQNQAVTAIVHRETRGSL